MKRWWFVIHVSENVLLNLESAWEQIYNLKLAGSWNHVLGFFSQWLQVSQVPLLPLGSNFSPTEESNDNTTLHEHNNHVSDE